MPKRLIVIALAAAGSLALAFLAFDRTATESAATLAVVGADAGAALSADEPMAPPAPDVGEEEEEELEVAVPRAKERRAQAATEADAYTKELADAQWVEGCMIFPVGTPADEKAIVVASGPRDFEHGPEHRVEVPPDGTFRLAFAKGTVFGTIRLEARYLCLKERVRVDFRKVPSLFILEPGLGGRIEGELILPSDGTLSLEDLDGGSLRVASRTIPVRGMVFEFDALPLGANYRVDLESEIAYGRQLGDLSLAAGETSKVLLEIKPCIAVEGRVLDDRCTPLPDVEVIASCHDFGSHLSAWRQATTDSDGAYAVRGLPPGKLTLKVDVDGFAPAERELLLAGEGESIRGIDLVLMRGLEITGHVRWPDGTPASEAWIEVELRFPGTSKASDDGSFVAFRSPQTLKAGDDGSFVADGLLDATYRLRLRAEREEGEEVTVKSSLTGKEHTVEQRTTWSAEAEDVPAGTSGIELVLDPGGAIAGFVRDDLGRSLDDFDVEALPMNASGSFLPHFRQFGSVRRSFQGTVGRFELEGLTVGTWSIAARARNHVASEGRVLRIPGELADVIELVVPRAGRIEGRVVGGALDYLEARTHVRLADGEGRDVSGAMTDAAGSFHFGGVAPGRMRVQAFDQEERVSASVAVEVRADEASRVELSVSKGASLLARVVDASGALIDVEAVELLDPEGEVVQVAERGLDGMYGLGIVPFGKHRVRVRHGGKTYEQEVSVGGDDVTVELLVE